MGISVSQQSITETTFSSLIINYVNHLANLFTNNFFAVNLFLGGILAFFVIYISRKEKFILFSIFSTLPIFLFGGHSSNYANLSLIAPAVIATTIFIKYVYLKKKYLGILILFLVAISNLFSVSKIIAKGQISLVIPRDMVLSNQLKLIDKTYEIAKGNPFSVNTLTLPLWTNTTWSYLYSWYGKNKYGYVPEFYGHNQIGLPGENDLIHIDKPLPLSFFIIEPHVGIPDQFFVQEIETENSKTKLKEEFTYGDLVLQLRELNNMSESQTK
jgi:hypothetical protein